MEILIYVITGAMVGVFIGWFAADAQSGSAFQVEKDAAAQRFSALEKEFAAYKTSVRESLREKLTEINALKDSSQKLATNLLSLNNELSAAKAELKSAMKTIDDKDGELVALGEELKEIKNEDVESKQLVATEDANTNESFSEG